MKKIRSIIQAVVHAKTRQEIEHAVCEHLNDLNRFEFVWIGEPEYVDEELEPEAWAGATPGYLETVNLQFDSEQQEPAVQTARTKDPTTVPNIAERVQEEPWRQTALRHDLRSVISVPLLHNDFSYGVLSIYGTAQSVFDELSTEILTELGELIGYAINAVEQRNALLNPGVTELTFELSEPTDPLIEMASQMGSRFEIRNLNPRPDGSYLIQLRVEDATPDRFTTTAEGFATVQEVRTMHNADSPSFELVVSESDIITTITSLAATVDTLTISKEQSQISICVPQDSDIREFIEHFRSQYPEATLLSRQTTTRDGPLQVASLLDQLTDRQREILRAAYFGGFFEQPRHSTGSDIANALGITQPAFSKQLRNCERKLLKPIFEQEEFS